MEAKDPASGSLYYYNESTGKSQWERPAGISFTAQPSMCSTLPEDWVEASDETTGPLYVWCAYLSMGFQNA